MKFLKWKVSIGLSGLLLFMVLVVVLFSAILGGKEIAEEQAGGEVYGCPVVESGKLTEVSLDAFLAKRGVFKGTARLFFKYGKLYHVDPALVVAIAMHETGNGSSRMVREMKNPGGLMGDTSGFRFSTLDKGIEAMIKNLGKNYIALGLTTPEKIQPKYAPVGASNDPNGTNKAWLHGVNGFLKQLGGQSSCSAGGSEGTGKYQIPVDHPVVSSGFVNRINPVTGQAESHKGLDFANPMGTPIKAADDGIVVVTMNNAQRGSGYGGYGNVTVLEHKKNKEWTLYAHQSKILVKEGQKVKKGQVIGKIGSTGQSTGPHLHFELRKQKMGGQINPAPVLGIQSK